MNDVVDFAKRRFAAAKDATETTPLDALTEALRRVREGEWPIESVIIVGQTNLDDMTRIESVHGGPASTNECMGILFRAQNALLP